MTATTPDEPRAVLAYGTLRPGGSLHHYATVWGDVEPTVTRNCAIEGYRLYDAGGFPYAWPAEPDCDCGGSHATIAADLLAYDAPVWRAVRTLFDQVEGYPFHYTRRIVQATTPSGETVSGWLYVPRDDPTDLPLIPSGDWHRRNTERRLA